MTAYHVIEIVIVGGVVGYAVWNFASRFLPKLRGGKAKTAGCADCGGGGCCDTPAQPKKTEQPVRFHR